MKVLGSYDLDAYAVLIDDPTDPDFERARAAGYLWAAGGAISFGFLLAPELPPDFHPLPLYASAGGSLLWGLFVLVRGLRFGENTFYGLTIGAVFLVAIGCYYSGTALGPFAAMFFIWAGTYGYYFFSRAKAAVITALIGVVYAVVLALQPGNIGAPSRWVFVMGSVIALSALVSWLTQREHAARAELAVLNADLEGRVATQLEEITRMGELRRFLSPQIADTVVEGGHDDLLEPHRREIAVLFCDLRGFTAFTSEVEPEEVLAVIDQYYEVIGGLLREFDATIGPLAGDGVMAYFNDPVPCSDPARRAVDLGLAMQSAVATLAAEWMRRGHELSCGVGVASGYATLGVIGFEGKRDYGPLGSVVNRASRLCDQAEAGQILVDASIHRQLGERCRTELLEEMELKGFPRPVPVYLVAQSS